MTLARAVVWLIAWLRVAPSLWVVPWWSARGMHPWLRVAVTCVIALGVAPAVGAPALPADGWLAVIALRELTLGVVLALVLAAPFVALRQAGALVDATRGVDAGDDAGLAALLSSLGAAVFLASGAHRGVLRALAATWTLVPVDADPRTPWPLDAWVERAARATGEMFLATVSVASGALLASLACELVLAAASRTLPGHDHVARSARAIAPLVALALTLTLATDAAREVMQSALTSVRSTR